MKTYGNKQTTWTIVIVNPALNIKQFIVQSLYINKKKEKIKRNNDNGSRLRFSNGENAN